MQWLNAPNATTVCFLTEVKDYECCGNPKSRARSEECKQASQSLEGEGKEDQKAKAKLNSMELIF